MRGYGRSAMKRFRRNTIQRLSTSRTHESVSHQAFQWRDTAKKPDLARLRIKILMVSQPYDFVRAGLARRSFQRDTTRQSKHADSNHLTCIPSNIQPCKTSKNGGLTLWNITVIPTPSVERATVARLWKNSMFVRIFTKIDAPLEKGFGIAK